MMARRPLGRWRQKTTCSCPSASSSSKVPTTVEATHGRCHTPSVRSEPLPLRCHDGPSEGTMNASASDRHRLHNRLEQLLGPEDAATLMEHLPPDEWNRLASKDDVLAVKG